MKLAPRQTLTLIVQPRRSGFILIAVLIVVLLASMVVVSLLFRLQAEETATAAGAGAEQAWAAAMSGIQEAMRVASMARPGSLEWHDNAAAFRERLILDEGTERWFFTVYGQGDGEEENLRFGLTAEAGKLNINEATEAMLEKLPAMTPYLVQGLLDFLDTDDTPRAEGAEQEYYDALANPYAIANAPLKTVEELLLVRGFTPALLFGEDANWNYQLDPNEDDAETLFPPDNQDGKLNLGLRQNLTVWSYDIDTDSGGAPRIDLNDPNADLAGEDSVGNEAFPAPVIAYIQALRRSNVKLGHPADLLEARARLKDENGSEVDMESGIGKTELPLVLDRLTTRLISRAPGLIDVNTASVQVLQLLPGIDEALADSIVAARQNLQDEQRRTPAWLFQEGVLDAGQFKAVAPNLTARTLQFHLRVVGYGVPSGRYRVLEAVIDTAGPKPAIVYLRDITRLGLPFRIQTNLEEAPESEQPGDERLALTPQSHG